VIGKGGEEQLFSLVSLEGEHNEAITKKKKRGKVKVKEAEGDPGVNIG